MNDVFSFIMYTVYTVQTHTDHDNVIISLLFLLEFYFIVEILDGYLRREFYYCSRWMGEMLLFNCEHDI